MIFSGLANYGVVDVARVSASGKSALESRKNPELIGASLSIS
jgi:hypothetical protein